jgi:hypothetical protein
MGHPNIMKSNDPFDRPPSSGIGAFYRRDWERTQSMLRPFGTNYLLYKEMNEISSMTSMTSTIGLMERERKFSADLFKSLNLLADAHRLTAVSQSALALSQHDRGMVAQIRILSRTIESGVFAVEKSLKTNNSVLSSVIAASKWQLQWKLLAEQLSPSLFALRTNAERLMMVDLATLRASAQDVQISDVQTVAEQAIELHELAEALSKAETAEDSAQLFVAFIAALAAIFGRLKENTADELRRLGLIGLLLIAVTIVSLPQLQPEAGMSLDEKKAYSELQDRVENLHQELRKIISAEGALEEEYVASLPRAEIARRTSIRTAPARSASRIMVADVGTPIAIAKAEKRWKLIVYRDPLTNQLAQGWVYEAVVVLTDPS